MPRKSRTSNVRKLCGCVKWQTCKHPWYLDYQRKKIRFRDNLDNLIDRHAPDFASAKDEARRAIVAKLDGRDPRGLVPSDDPTLAQLLAQFDQERPRHDRWQIGRIVATEIASPDGPRRFGDWRASAITADTLKRFRQLRPAVQGNRDLSLLRAAFNWAVPLGLLPSTPFKVGGVPVVKLTREEPRSRRLQPGEAERLELNANSLRDLITAALETGCRKGELLSLQWSQIRFFPRGEIYLPAHKTKAKRDRRVPISRLLRAVLDRRRNDPAGKELPSDAYVFGDDIGRKRGSIKTAWRLTCQRARIENLHFHDLRREAGSRWMDAGVPLSDIQRWLGHSNISQTSTYLGASIGNDEAAMQAYEARIGRLTQIDVSDTPTGSDRPQTDTTAIEKTEQNLVGYDPTRVVH